jgi:hypothetical protein
MARGFGWVQLAALVHLYEWRVDFTGGIARAIFGGTPTASDMRSLRRALRRLRKDGLVASCGRTKLMWIMPRGVPERLGWLPRGPGPDMAYGFDPTRQRRRGHLS